MVSVFCCSHCDYHCNRKRDLEIHEKSHTGLKDFQCDLCEKSFVSDYGLAKHKRHVHENVRRFACNQCDYTCDDQCHLDRHMLIHTGTKPFVCSECDMAFTRKDQLEQHMPQHTDAKNYVCDECHQSFKNRSTLRTHKFTHSNEKPYKCSHCDYACTQLSNLKKHIKKMHKTETTTTTTT